MSLAIVYSRARVGVDAPQVTVEVHISNGLPSLSIVGLPETAVRESKDRVRGALVHSGFEFPRRRITINLAPADLPKEGGRFDLPIALGILAASGQLRCETFDRYEFIGELALSGALRGVGGVLPAALAAVRLGRSFVCPADCLDEASLADSAHVSGAHHLLQICLHFNAQGPLLPAHAQPEAATPGGTTDLREVRGQHRARRALEVAASGGHNLLFIGPPGTGKTLVAGCLPGILPPQSLEEALQSAAIASVSAQGFDPGRWRVRPFRSPHHTASAVALVGGGPQARPGEVSLAHTGVLFLDELPEFRRDVLEALREPLESGRITISRAAQQADYPAAFQLVASMNPCPCGWLGDPSGRCRCSAEQVRRYRARVSGPLLDRIDLHIDVPRLAFSELSASVGESSARVMARVVAARARQQARQQKLNAHLDTATLGACCALDAACQALIERISDRHRLSLRAHHRVLKVARTLADLDASEPIRHAHLAEALSMRCLDLRPPDAH